MKFQAILVSSYNYIELGHNKNDMPLFVTGAMEGQDHNPLKSQKAAAAMAGVKAVAPALMAKIKVTA